MSSGTHILAIDQGTTSSRAIVFDQTGKVCGVAQRELPQIFPANGWVEHDAAMIWADTLDVCRGAIDDAGLSAADIAAIGITNQRETTVVWDRRTGEPIHNAIVWQDRRTAELCRKLSTDENIALIQDRSGLVLDAYFSATKVKWLLDNVEGARGRAEKGELAFGTIDCWLLWNLTGGKVHATDATNASRTMLFDITAQTWDQDLLALFDVPASVLPDVVDNSGQLGMAEEALLGAEIPVTGMAGDQQAAAFGQACFLPGMVKSTYGTGCFALMNVGDKPIMSRNRLLGTVAYRLNGKTSYAIEGSIFMAGATIQWIRDMLKIVSDAADTEDLAKQAAEDSSVYLVPGFVGLGAPYWDPDARGAILGMTRDSGVAEIAKAALESVAYQTRDLLEAMEADMKAEGVEGSLSTIRVDGGMVANNWAMQFLANLCQANIERPEVTETTALGAAYLAGLEVGLFSSLDDISAKWQLEKPFSPEMDKDEAASRYAGWQDAVKRTLTSETP